ncbi:hypothetical protein PGT21_023357 [Puccinia graminis f. sp. tritici]|uniref:Uncharacterized protein n=1 Tax=Puccinia graminis f. sp. tritici TaxID=56615 RepID=A0A5B0MFB2_PUCGR|nr:hypothetical protein PGT21_023357 [Puccinia graminis f. sp. tritici]
MPHSKGLSAWGCCGDRVAWTRSSKRGLFLTPNIDDNRIDQVVEGGGRNFCWILSRSTGYRHTGLNPPEDFLVRLRGVYSNGPVTQFFPSWNR